MQDVERKLKRIKALRKFREVEQLRLAAELHAHERRLRRAAEAADRAARYLDDDLPLGGLLSAHGLREAAHSMAIVDAERGLIKEISHKNVQSKSIKDALVEVEAHLGAQLEQSQADEALMETVATWPSILRLAGKGEAGRGEE